MSRIEVIGDAVLHVGDCREILPTNAVVTFDGLVGRKKGVVLLTDPPYGINYGNSGGFSPSHGWGPWRANVEWDASRPDRATFDLMRGCTDEQIIWGGNYFTDYLTPSMGWLIWDKGQRNFSLADCEMAWCSRRMAARVFTYSRGAAVRDGKEHPTQKPLQVMQWCLGFLPAATTILDPFMGSGMTGVAALRLGRKFIGIEIHEPYFEIALRRIEAEHRRPRLALPEPISAPKQEALL